MLLALLVSPLAHAAYVTAIGEDVSIGLSGNFARVAVSGDSTAPYTLFWAAGGDYNRIPLAADFSYDSQQRVAMTGHTDLVDDAIRQCPDGTWLMAGSANLSTPNDTAYTFTFDADFNKLSDVNLDVQNPALAHNDMPLWCGDARLVGFTGTDMSQWIIELNADGSELARHQSTNAAQLEGGQFYRAEAEDDTLYTVGGQFQNGAEISRYDASYTIIDTQHPPISPAGEYSYWPQGLLRVGDYFVIVHMGRSATDAWDQDTGNVYVTIVSMTDWTVVEQDNLTNYAPGAGAMRPWAARDGNDLLVTFDVDLHPHVMRVSLDTGALGETSSTDSGSDGANGASAGVCGCAATGGSAGVGALTRAVEIFLLVAFCRRTS